MKKGFYTHIEKDTLENTAFRKVLYSGEHMQLVLMSLLPGEEIGMEVHEENDQFFRFESGEGKVVINGNEYSVRDGDSVIIPAHSQHNVINTGSSDLKMYTLYAPAHHKDGIMRQTKEEAVQQEASFDGVTSE